MVFKMVLASFGGKKSPVGIILCKDKKSIYFFGCDFFFKLKYLSIYDSQPAKNGGNKYEIKFPSKWFWLAFDLKYHRWG